MVSVQRNSLGIHVLKFKNVHLSTAFECVYSQWFRGYGAGGFGGVEPVNVGGVGPVNVGGVGPVDVEA